MPSNGRGWLIGCGVVALFLVIAGGILIGFATLSGRTPTSLHLGPRVGVVEVFGVIGEDDDVLEQLDDFADDPSIEALVLHVNSPGGAVGTTQRIVARLQTMDLPIIAALDDVAASGGYYVATVADSIFVLPGTLTGSIGVIMSFPDLSALMQKVGVDYQVVKTGPFKDAGSPFRPLTSEERAWIGTVLDDVHDQFVTAVAEGRGLDPDSVRTLADGRFFSGRMACDWGLADRIGDLDEAILAAGEMAGISGEPPVERKRRVKRAWDRWFEERMPDLRGMVREPHLEFRWR
jgi:protease-4